MGGSILGQCHMCSYHHDRNAQNHQHHHHPFHQVCLFIVEEKEIMFEAEKEQETV